MTTTATPYRSTVQSGGDGFGRLLRAEWTKLRSVPRWGLTMLAAVLLTMLVSLLTAAGGDTTGGGGGGPAPGGPLANIQDQGHLVHRTLTGDGSVVARVASQARSHKGAKAGLMIRQSTKPGTPYAAIMVTPERGVRLQSNFDTDIGGGDGGAPRWLKLTRSGASVTGYQSADGTTWKKVGTVKPGGLGPTTEAGPFVASPDQVKTVRQFGGESIDSLPTSAEATFDHVATEPAQQAPWRSTDRTPEGPALQGGEGGSFTQAGGTFKITGMGDVTRDMFGDDSTQRMLTGVLLGLTAIVALAVLFVTTEYRRGMIWATLAASPRRGRVLAAKAVVIGAASFAAGLVAAFGAYLIAGPLAGGGAPPNVPISEGAVLRALVGTAALLALIAVFSMAVGTLLRHSAAAITSVLLLILLPYILATGLPLSVAKWVERLTPAAGFAIQKTVERYDTAIGPWAGLGVLAAYTVVALALAAWRLQRSDA